MLRNRIQILILILCLWGASAAQQGTAGVEEPTWIGFSARMMALGGAGGAAYPNDPSAFTWNPAGMRVVENKSLELSHTTLNFGTQYHFIGYMHPTMRAGSFGFGISRVGVEDVPHVKNVQGVPQSLGNFTYYWGKLSLAYAFPLWGHLSSGVTFDAHRQVMGDLASVNGFGINYGLHFGSAQARGVLKHFYIGLSASNIISRMDLGSREDIPGLMRMGMAKGFVFRKKRDHIFFLIDGIRQGEEEVQPVFGMEYGIGQTVFFRAGHANALTFGAGLRIKGMQLDYASGQFSDNPALFDRSHRFSLIFHFGKSISEQIRLEQESQTQQIQERLFQRMEEARLDRIYKNLKKGREFYDAGDYQNACVAFQRVLDDDPEHKEARQLLETASKAEEDRLQNKEQELIRQTAESEKQRLDREFIDSRFAAGLGLYKKESYQDAIDKWQEALERDPDNTELKTHIQKAKTALNNQIDRWIAQARNHINRKEHSEAYRLLDLAKTAARSNQSLLSRVDSEIHRLDRLNDFISYYQEGVARFRKDDFENAARFLKQALKFQPNDEQAKDYYSRAMAQLKAKTEPENVELKGDVRAKYNEGLDYYRVQQYDQALRVWQEALELNPHNMHLIKAVQAAKDRLQMYGKNEK